jgi:serine/threonine protein kinase
MMTREGTVKLIDFGIATRSGTRDHSLTGKPAYMAPEMVVELRADNRSDIFSLGAVLYEMLTAERLFGGATTSEVLEQVIGARMPAPRTKNPAIPDIVVEILTKALQRDAAKRYMTAGEMGGACEHFLYDKGYGPTNLTLKQYLAGLFPESIRGTFRALDESSVFPVIEPTLIPISDGIPNPHTMPADGATNPGPKLEPADPDGETMVAPRAKRIKKRAASK